MGIYISSLIDSYSKHGYICKHFLDLEFVVRHWQIGRRLKTYNCRYVRSKLSSNDLCNSYILIIAYVMYSNLSYFCSWLPLLWYLCSTCVFWTIKLAGTYWTFDQKMQHLEDSVIGMWIFSAPNDFSLGTFENKEDHIKFSNSVLTLLLSNFIRFLFLFFFFWLRFLISFSLHLWGKTKYVVTESSLPQLPYSSYSKYRCVAPHKYFTKAPCEL